MVSRAPGSAFIRIIAIGRIRTFFFKHALRRRLVALGVDPGLVHYRPTRFRAGLLNELTLDARLDVALWQDIASWCAEHFHSLRVHEVIGSQLRNLRTFGVTGEEPYEIPARL